MPLRKVIISGGGTGGHIFPAVAIANKIKENYPEVEILFVGAEGKMEMEKVPKAGYKIVGLPIRGLQRKLTLKNLAVPFKLIASLMKSKRIVKSFQPSKRHTQESPSTSLETSHLNRFGGLPMGRMWL